MIQDRLRPTGKGGPVTSEKRGRGFHASVATSLDEVIEAWQFVYEAYRRIGAIHPNPWCLHTVPQAVHNDTVVILGRNGSRLVNTMTVHFDRELGLSLDSIYKLKLDELRGQDRELIEVGLFADRRDFGFRSIKPLMEVMRLAWHYGIGNGSTDGIIGVSYANHTIWETPLPYYTLYLFETHSFETDQLGSLSKNRAYLVVRISFF